MTALEALALGTPLVAHRTGGLVEILADYQQLLVNEHQPSAYASCIAAVLRSGVPRVELRDSYKSTNNRLQVVELYQRLVADNVN